MLHDVTQQPGLEHTIGLVCRCKANALIWLVVPCSSWVFVGRSNAGRYAWYPAGDNGRAYTQQHNHIAFVAANLALLAFHLGLLYVIEQPGTSVLFDWLPLLRILARTKARRGVGHMIGFGGTSMKTLRFRGTVPWLESLECLSKSMRRHAAPASTALVEVRTLQSGRASITGKRKELKDSGAYTRAFAEAVATRQAINVRAHARAYVHFDQAC